MRHLVNLRCGTLTLDIEEAEVSLDELCGFGTRRNRKRAFLFISKVLGKHIPVRPSLMQAMHRRLARKLVDVPGPTVLIALAETATALGQGVFEELLTLTGRDDVVFLHSTRYRLNRPLALTFDESHSHATDHRLYRPIDGGWLFDSARSLILVDDEISTGRTLVQLAGAYRQLNPALEQVHLVCLTDWLGRGRREAIRDELGLSLRFHHLLRGEYRFVPNESFDPGEVPDVIGKPEAKDAILSPTGGRLGLTRPMHLDLDALACQAGVRASECVLVLGTGEFSYPPYRLALHLEERGYDVVYQSTTRSPILAGEAIGSVLEFVDNYHDDIPNYVYNVADRRYDRIVIGYETHQLPPSHRLPEMLDARVIYFT